jgi:acetyltransferase-like isoleucine patch superfamily enzyme
MESRDRERGARAGGGLGCRRDEALAQRSGGAPGRRQNDAAAPRKVGRERFLMNIDAFVQKVRRGETPFYAWLNRRAKGMLAVEAPCLPRWHGFLYRERQLRIGLWRNFWRVWYYQPMFRSQCDSCGRGLYIYQSDEGIPLLDGNVSVTIGDDVKIIDKSAIVGLTVADRPRLVIGDNTDIPLPISIFIGNEVSIGSNCMIGCELIADNPGHRTDYKKRIDERIEVEKIGKVIIHDYVWAAHRSIIVGNVTIGTGAIIAAMAVVTKDVPPFCVMAGNPARLVRKLPFPEEMIERVGAEQYRLYQEAQVQK